MAKLSEPLEAFKVSLAAFQADLQNLSQVLDAATVAAKAAEVDAPVDLKALQAKIDALIAK